MCHRLLPEDAGRIVPRDAEGSASTTNPRRTDMRNTRNLHRWGLMLGGLMICIAAASLGPRKAAFATPSSGFTSQHRYGVQGVPEITLKTLSPTHQVRIRTEGLSDVHVTTNVVLPGGTSGWHTHPGPSIVVVKSGTATLYDGDDPTCTPHVVEAGGAFVDIGGGVTFTCCAMRTR